MQDDGGGLYYVVTMWPVYTGCVVLVAQFESSKLGQVIFPKRKKTIHHARLALNASIIKFLEILMTHTKDWPHVMHL